MPSRAPGNHSEIAALIANRLHGNLRQYRGPARLDSSGERLAIFIIETPWHPSHASISRARFFRWPNRLYAQPREEHPVCTQELPESLNRLCSSGQNPLRQAKTCCCAREEFLDLMTIGGSAPRLGARGILGSNHDSDRRIVFGSTYAACRAGKEFANAQTSSIPRHAGIKNQS